MPTELEKKSAFEQAHEEKTIVGEFFALLKKNKKFWMIPIIISLLALGLLVALGGTAAAPFIYSLF